MGASRRGQAPGEKLADTMPSKTTLVTQMLHDARRAPDSDLKIEYSNQDWTVALRATLLALAPVALDLMAGLLEVARLFGIEFGLCSADFANENMEVGEDFIASDKSWESEFLDGHSTPPAESIAKGRRSRSRFFRVSTATSPKSA